MKKILIPVLAGSFLFAGCTKDDNNGNATEDLNTLKTTAINDFVNKVAMPDYLQLKTKAATLNTGVTNLNTSTTEENLTLFFI